MQVNRRSESFDCAFLIYIMITFDKNPKISNKFITSDERTR